MGVLLRPVAEPFEIPEGFRGIVGQGPVQVLRFFDDEVYDGEEKGYNVYKLISANGVFVLKKFENDEDLLGEVKHYGLLCGLPVPPLLGVSDSGILLGFVDGEDLKRPTGAGVLAAAESLCAVMNAYPMGREYERDRYETYLRRLERRAKALTREPELARAFSAFLGRQREIPLTLSNGDLLPLNVLYDGRRAVIIDWGFGGFMPYALDIARFYSHGQTLGSATPFYMTDAQKELFKNAVYGGLSVKPPRETYERDLLLAELNECVEILEYYLNDPSAERGAVFQYYYPHALALARTIE